MRDPELSSFGSYLGGTFLSDPIKWWIRDAKSFPGPYQPVLVETKLDMEGMDEVLDTPVFQTNNLQRAVTHGC